MASIINSSQLLLNRSRFSALPSSPSRVSRNLVLLKSRSNVAGASRLELLPSPENQVSPTSVECSGKPWVFAGWERFPRRHGLAQSLVPKAAAADAEGREIEISDGISKSSKSFAQSFPALVTGFFFFTCFVSLIHLLVGVVYCLVSWAVGLPKRAPIDRELFVLLTPVAVCHALGHVMSNVSFAAVAVSFTHSIKALELFFNAAASQFVLGRQIPLSLLLSLAPVVMGVSIASMTELSFNWTGFVSAMISNIAFTYRSIYSKKAMTGMDSTNVFAYISIIALLFCIPPAVFIEGPQLMQHGFGDAIAKVGINKFLSDLFCIGMFYHLYNQVATNTLERVAPLKHAAGNVLKRVFVIGSLSWYLVMTVCFVYVSYIMHLENVFLIMQMVFCKTCDICGAQFDH